MDNATERNGFYDDDYQTYVNYVLTDVKRIAELLPEVGKGFVVAWSEVHICIALPCGVHVEEPLNVGVRF